MSNDFQISNNILRKYGGPGGDVVIPDGITQIAPNAFAWSDVTSVTIPEGVESIGNSAFNWCKSLTTVHLPQSLTHIYNSAFSGCSNLAGVTLPDGLQVLQGYAFQHCSSLGHIRIPGSVKEIEASAFNGCSGLRAVELCEGLTTIGKGAFSGTGFSSVAIPASVETIGEFAFSNCSNLWDVQIPDSVQTIGECAFWGCNHMADKDGLVIVRDMLYHCKDTQKEAIVPASVTAISPQAFGDNKNLTRVVLPEGLTAIPRNAFINCEKLQEVIIPDSVQTIGQHAFEGCKSLKTIKLPASLQFIDECVFRGSGLTEIQIPEGVTAIKGGAFRESKNLKKVVMPETLTSIEVGDYPSGPPFVNCDKLEEFTGGSPELKLPKDIFGHWSLPTGLAKNVDTIVFKMSDPAALQYVVKSNAFANLSLQNQVTLMLTKQGKTLLKEYNDKRLDWGKVALEILSRINDKYTIKECNAVATLMVACCDRFTEERVQALYNALDPLKTAAKAKKTIADCTALSKKLKLEARVDEKLTGLAKLVAENLLAAGKTEKELKDDLKKLYSLTPKDLPVLKDTKGKKVDPIVFVWLMTAHEEMEKSRYNPETTVSYDKPGIRPEAQPILAQLDRKVLMDALRTIANDNLGMTGKSKKMYLAYPICRYADEKLMEELTKTAPSWRSTVSGNNAPSLLSFRKANAYSDTRAAMMFADKYKELDYYARIRGTDADTLRDQNLSDVGIDEKGGKTYDLGNQTVVARLQPDLSFLIELPTGKTAKSLPKKGADETLYAAANADFSEVKKAVKKILKNRNTVLFEDFLKGKQRPANSWKSAYLDNVLLNRAAKLLVWEQDQKTFTVTDSGLILSDGTAYELTDKPVALAHPMDMDKEELKAWQQYFTKKGLKQPFEQIWEPVVDPATIKADRYKGCMIPYYRFTGQTKHGIHVEDVDFHAEINITFDDCDVEIDRIDWARHSIDPDDRFEVREFKYRRYTRKVNHIAAYLDKVTVFGRIAKDDITIADRLDSFTLAQITECLKIAQENNASNVTALLLEHKNTHFSDFDPMAEFTLDL